MRNSIKKGLGFGLTSGIITTLGMIVGLQSGTHSEIIVVGGIMIIAVADALSDALGIHVSEEAEHCHTVREIWEATLATFIFKFLVALTFVAPILAFDFSLAVVVSIVWGLSLLSFFSWIIAKKQKVSPYKVIGEHLLIAVLVIVATHYLGDWIGSWR